MNDRMSRLVKDILAGTASVETAQACLAKLDSNDLKAVFPEDELEVLMDRYKARNHYEAAPLIRLSRAQRHAGWQEILAAVQVSRKGPVRQFGRRMGAQWIRLSELFTAAPSVRWGLSLALLLLILSPVWHHYQKSTAPSYLGEKGTILASPAAIQFSLVNPAGKLVRPDRTITEADTLAFRVQASRPGFCSIYMVYQDRIDPILADRPLAKGIHDLDVAYALEGNRGTNTLVMLFSTAPVEIKGRHEKRLLIEAARNRVTSMTIENTQIYFATHPIAVNRKPSGGP